MSGKWNKETTDLLVAQTVPKTQRPHITFKVLGSVLLDIPVVSIEC